MLSMMSLPMPGQLNTVSVTTAKARVEPNSSPNTVTIGMPMFLSTCSRSTWLSGRPWARAKRTCSLPITSSVPARTRRIRRPSLNNERFSAGSSRCLHPSAVNTLTPSGPTGPRPPEGSQRISTEKNRISSSPTQKVGTEKPTTEQAMIAWLERASGL